jgi:two-component system, NtrC family, sensor kinase
MAVRERRGWSEQGGQVVARPWHLRHKLLLGLALVIAILGTLLGGSVQGLSSYITTMKITDAKLAELQFAEELRGSIQKLGTRGDPVEDRAGEPARIAQRLRDTRDTLARYKQQHLETIQRRRDPDDGANESGVIQALEDSCKQFEAALKDAGQPKDVGDQDTLLVDDPGVRAAHARMVQAADGLHKAIYDDMYNRISVAKDHHRRSMFIVVTCTSAAVLLMAGMLYFFYGWVLFPLRRIQQGVRHVAAGEFHHPISLQTGDELEELANAFDDMASRVQATHADLMRQVNERSRQLVRSERLVSVGFLAAGVAHEINNPLASIAFCAEGLLRRLHDIGTRYPQEGETIQKYLTMIQSEAFRCKEITQNLLEFSRVGERRREPTDVCQLIQGVLEMAHLLPGCRGKQILFQPQIRPVALINAQDVKSVVLNLVVNALDSMEEGGVLTIHLGQRGTMAEMVFHDTGCGMEAEVLENIFEPFYTRSRTGKGTGLGLFISHQIIAQHDGVIEAHSEGPGRGSVFTVRLPLQGRATMPAAEGAFAGWPADAVTIPLTRAA